MQTNQIFCLKDKFKRLSITFVGIILMIGLVTACTDDYIAQELPDNIVTADELVWQGIKPGYTTVEEMIALLGEADYISETEYLRIYEYYEGWQCLTYTDNPQLIRTIMIGPAEIGTLPPVTRDIKIGDSFDEVFAKFPNDKQETMYNGAVTLYYGNFDSGGGYGMLTYQMSNGTQIYKGLQYTADNSATLAIGFDEHDQVEKIQINFFNNSSNNSSFQTQVQNEVRMPQEGLYKIEAEVSFREGVAAEGAALLTNEDVEGFYTIANKVENRYDIVFVFTEVGSQSFADITTRLTGEILSIWVGDECLATPRIVVQITEGEAAISLGDIDEQSLKIWTDKLIGE